MQGVGFRWFVREQAHRLRVSGWVRNTPDGAVEVAACVPDESLEQFRAALVRGPEGAVVRSVRDAAIAVGQAYPDPFEISA